LVLVFFGVLAVVAGMVLAIGQLAGWPAWAISATGVALAIGAGVPQAWSSVSGLWDEDSQQRSRLREILEADIQPVSQVDPSIIGITPSKLAEKSSAVPGTAPYVARDVEDAIDEAFSEVCLAHHERLVVLSGDPKAGKSRTLWEAVRRQAGPRRLVALCRPTNDEKSPQCRPLETLVGLKRALSHQAGRDFVVWVDDAHEHFDRGLTRENLRRLMALHPQAIVVLTVHSARLAERRKIDPQLYRLLANGLERLVLNAELSRAEQARARDAYPALVHHQDFDRFAELLAGVPELIDKYRTSWSTQPVGVAVAKAVMVWEQAGMPAGSLDEATLRFLTEKTLATVAPAVVLTDESFDEAIAWATKPVAAAAALVRVSRVKGKERYRGYEAVVSWFAEDAGPLSDEMWDFVLRRSGRASSAGPALRAQRDLGAPSPLANVSRSEDVPVAAGSADLFGVGLAAYNAKRWDIAESAWGQALSGSTGYPAAASALALRMLLQEQGRLAEAEGRLAEAEKAYRAATASITEGETLPGMEGEQDVLGWTNWKRRSRWFVAGAIASTIVVVVAVGTVLLVPSHKRPPTPAATVALGTWSSTQQLDPNGYLESVSCPTTTFCAAVDDGGYGLTYSDGVWSSAQRIDANGYLGYLESVSCPTTTFCAAVDDEGYGLTYSGGKWSSSHKIDPNFLALHSVSCATTTFCVAMDDEGYEFAYSNGKWSSPHKIDPGSLAPGMC
jgi:tetratricopeptide (TPR) repeat protein